MFVKRCKELLATALLLLFCRRLCAQQSAQFIPEVDVHIKMNSFARLRIQTMHTIEGGDPPQATVGPDLELYVKPLIRLAHVREFDLDDAKKRLLVFSIGYRYLGAPGVPSTNRTIPMATTHFPLGGGFVVTDINRADLDVISGKFKWRYRNETIVGRPLTIGSYHPSPYVGVEVYYTEQYHKWSTTEIYIGSQLPIKKRFAADIYYEHQNNTGKQPNSQVHGIGAKLNIFFR
jgi:hypothetical protein